MVALKITNLKKQFGNRDVIKGIDLEVPERSIFGFIGPNGAGKTTTMKMVLGLLRPDAGTIEVCGNRVRYGETKTNRHIGYLPDAPEFYGHMKPIEYLRLCGAISGMSKQQARTRGQDLLDLVGLTDAHRRIAGFSRGMKQRLGIAQALLGKPDLLICDEPTSALDPVGRVDVLDILQKVQGETTVVFSTHILADVERICDRIAILSDGHISLSGSLADIKAAHAREGFLVEFANSHDRAQFAETAENAGGTMVFEGDRVVTVTFPGDSAGSHTLKAIQALAHIEVAPLKFESLEPTLEHLFMEAIA